MQATEIKSNEKITKYNKNRSERLTQTPAGNSSRKDAFLTGVASSMCDSQILSQSQVNFHTYRGEVLDLKDKITAHKQTENYLLAK